jgi:release factor glutamine methyltransferase
MAVSVDELLTRARHELAAAPFGPSSREALLLVASSLSWSEARVLAHPEERVGPQQETRFEELLARRLTGEPIAYLLGEKEFFGRRFEVDSRVLIPRPETEHLVEAALETPLPERARLLDLGTGSGCIAITLAVELAGARVTAVDASLAALAVARKNAESHAVEDRISFIAGDLATAIDLTRFDLVVCNPPYIGVEEAASLSPEVREFEPAEALFAPGTSESVLCRLMNELATLRKGVPLLVEIGCRQSEGVRRHLENSHFELLELRPDYAGIPRILRTRRR